MRTGTTKIVLLILITGTFLVYILESEAKHAVTTIVAQPIYSQPDSVVLIKTNITSNLAPTTADTTTFSPAPEVNDTLIGGSTPTTSNNTLPIDQTNNKTGVAEPLEIIN
jgi:hypothetical protein